MILKAKAFWAKKTFYCRPCSALIGASDAVFLLQISFPFARIASLSFKIMSRLTPSAAARSAEKFLFPNKASAWNAASAEEKAAWTRFFPSTAIGSGKRNWRSLGSRKDRGGFLLCSPAFFLRPCGNWAWTNCRWFRFRRALEK